MGIVKLVLGRIWLVWAALWFVGFFLITYPFFALWLSTPKLYRIAHFQRRIWGVVTSIPALLVPVIEQRAPLPKNRRIIYCANHFSYLDILTCGTYLPGFNFFMAKKELMKVPLFGIWFRTLDVPVERAKARESFMALVNASKQFDTGVDMVIFPEGRIPDNYPKLAKFKAGAFRLAIEKQAVIVPVTLPDNYKRFPDGKWIATPGLMRTIMHEPIDTAGMTAEDEDALMQKVHSIIAGELQACGINQA